MANMAPSTTSLTGFPAEILLDIFKNLDIESVFQLASVNKAIYSFVEFNKATIVLPILQKEFSPFDELLHLFTASEEDLRSPGATYQPRKVVFKSSPLDLRGITLAIGGFRTSTSKGDSFTPVSKGFRARSSTVLSSPRTAVLVGNRTLDSLLKYCRIVRKWEELFPQFRWSREPANCRWLNDDEKLRLRRALYRWWLYAVHFHGDMPRPRRGLPEPYVDDIRTSHIRMLPTAEVAELHDLLGTVKDLIKEYFCPWLEQSVLKVWSLPSGPGRQYLTSHSRISGTCRRMISPGRQLGMDGS